MMNMTNLKKGHDDDEDNSSNDGDGNLDLSFFGISQSLFNEVIYLK